MECSLYTTQDAHEPNFFTEDTKSPPPTMEMAWGHRTVTNQTLNTKRKVTPNTNPDPDPNPNPNTNSHPDPDPNPNLNPTLL